MKKLLPFFLLMLSVSIFSQIPSYYNDIDLSLTNTALKDALSTKIISTQQVNLSYSPGVWNALKQSDLDITDNSKVVLIYGYDNTDANYVTDITRSKDANGGSAGTQWNREHVYPKSLGTPNLGTSGSGADIHHLRPADISFNSQRSSKKFVAGSGNAGSVSGGWYPGDQWKGDVARMMMYMYLRYGNQCLPSNVAIGSANPLDSNMINLLLEWNVEDPVSDFEKQRNPIIESIQGNRNPFIDNPAFATQIWGGPQAENLFENTNNDSNTTTDTDTSSEENNTPTTEIPTTTSITVADLFITEYIEGSSNNKALEIANFTGNAINLEGYSLKKASNGGGWTNTLTLSGVLNNQKMYVIANNSATSALKNKAQLLDTSVLSFNGNDAIGLFKENILIDVIGNPSSSVVFAKDKTLQRKASIKQASTVYDASQWNILSKDTFDGVSNHVLDANAPTPNIEEEVKEEVAVTYCVSKGKNANYEYIDNVVIGGISNATKSNGGYADFTAQTASLNYGNNELIVSAGFSSEAYTEFWKVWIDFNKNGVFENDEQVVSGSSSSAGNLSSNIYVPSSVLTGKTRMRVSMKWDAKATACETFSHGEVEDYTVTIGQSQRKELYNTSKNIFISAEKLGNQTPIFSANFYPNPAVNFINIQVLDNRNAQFRIINMNGQTVLKGQINHDTINVSNLNKGIYILEINDNQKIITKKFIKK
ncbi:endonuclease [Tenacibaculum dicentrarchi]|uniref:endonuclease n=1 Tax=Tenacibaculum dicentrarchi TaxID=669041 RepID=UPI000C7CB0E3|nr:endonuclease [Tenacibaculum dicentrarchi]MCD8415566.1 endonuclease [Tenacibaculum dicentrarchi]MCD8420690.1 endonuclease [Tenacibaculum dicentrarchi]MCD8435393.1 endonuclease [Tenacibaculum dicentrarchi]MCD8437865.1 endonuclease [Tenacibaculum dicentrarchi]